jgi:hypothetical protein
MPDYGWAYINLDVLKQIQNEPAITGGVALCIDPYTISSSHWIAASTSSDGSYSKLSLGRDFPNVLPEFQLDVQASAGDAIAARFIGDVEISGTLAAERIVSELIISSSNLVVSDSIIGLGFGSGSAETGSVGDRGFVFGLAGDQNQALFWDQTSGSFILGKVGAAGPTDTSFEVADANLSVFKVKTLTASSDVVSALGEFDTLTVGSTTATSIIDISGTPADNQVAVWTNANTVEGTSTLTFDGNGLTAVTITGSVGVSGSLGEFETLNVKGELSGNAVVSGSSFFSNGVELSTLVPSITSYTNSTNNRVITSVDSTTVNAEANMTFDGSILGVTGQISGSGVVSGSSFFSNGVELSTLVPSITSYTNSTNNRVITSVDSTTVNAEANMTFDGSILGVTGQISGSGVVSGSAIFSDGVQLGAVTSYTNATDNRILTSAGAKSINAEANATFDGTTFSLTGATHPGARIGLNRASPSAMLHMSASAIEMPVPMLRIDHPGGTHASDGAYTTQTPLLMVTASIQDESVHGCLLINHDGSNIADSGTAVHVKSKGNDAIIIKEGQTSFGHGYGALANVDIAMNAGVAANKNVFYVNYIDANDSRVPAIYVLGGDTGDKSKIGFAGPDPSNRPEATVSMGFGKHLITINQPLVKAHNADNTVIALVGSGSQDNNTPYVKIPANSVISRVAAVVSQNTNLSTYKVNVQMSATKTTLADAAISSGTEILGAGAPGTRAADSVGAPIDIDMTQATKDTWINNDLQWCGASDQYVYVCNAGTGNGTTDATQGKLIVMIEYYGMD